MDSDGDPTPLTIEEIAERLGVAAEHLHPYGRRMAKVDLNALDAPRLRTARPRLVLVSTITPTIAGQGKTTTSIGLAQALLSRGESVCLALREPPLGRRLSGARSGIGGGRCGLIPSEEISLHFTGDMHAVASAHNLLAAMLDNHIYHDNDLRIDPRRVLWRRVLDLDDRSLRHAVLGLGGREQGVPRESGFDSVLASEVLAMLCVAENVEDLRARLNRILVAFTYRGESVTAQRLQATGAMLALLKDALMPNLAQSTEGVPTLLHGGPAADVTHGASSVIATRMALHHADWAITAAGYGFDLGAEKFYDIVLRGAGLDTAAVVLVASARALKIHGGAMPENLDRPDPEAVKAGLPNLVKHLENIDHFGETPIVALNRHDTDTQVEIDIVRELCRREGVPFALSDPYARGGEGAADLAELLVEHAEAEPSRYGPLYGLEQSVPAKIFSVAKKMYGARSVTFAREAEHDLREVSRLGYDHFPVCIAKVHSSLTDDPDVKGRPEGFDITVRSVQIHAGAGYLVVRTGDVDQMPGLSPHPLAETLDVERGRVTGLD